MDEAEKHLLEHTERFQIFQRAGELVRVIRLPKPHKEGGLQRSEGSVQLEPLNTIALTESFERIVLFQRIDKNGCSQTVDCPPRIAQAYISRTGSWRVPPLAGIVAAPILLENGSVLTRPGYNSETGLFFHTDEDWPSIPERPTRQEVENAVRVLHEPFSEFPFVSESDFAVHIAGILTAIQRRLLEACPIFGYSAPTQRSGKSLLAESLSILVTGRPAPATAVSREKEEMRKAITSALREGHQAVNLDNIEIPLASPELAKAITQPEYQDRVLGESRMLRLPTNVLWTATGNNLTFRGDLSSRALLCRIDSRMERPEERNFKILNLRDFLARNRKQLIAAALTVLRAYYVAGRPRQKVAPWGGFEDWSRSIREPLIWAGLSDPCGTREVVLADDPEREESITVLLALRDEFGNAEFTVKEIIERSQAGGALRTAILNVAASHDRKGEIDPKRLGWWCRQTRDRTIDGLRLRRCGKASSKLARWRVEVQAGSEGGHGGQEGHFPATESSSSTEDDLHDEQSNAKRAETDPADPTDTQVSPPPTPIPCAVCGEMQPSRLAFSQHLRGMHSQGLIDATG